MNTIRVINDHPHPVRGRYDGRDYVFHSGKGEDIPPDAAAHIFGFGSDDKLGALNRLGQLRPDSNVEEALKFFDKIRFLEGKVTFEDDESGDDRSHVRSSEAAGAEQSAPASSLAPKTPSLKK